MWFVCANATIDIVKSGQKTPKIEIGYISSGESLLLKRFTNSLGRLECLLDIFEPTNGAIYAKDSL